MSVDNQHMCMTTKASAPRRPLQWVALRLALAGMGLGVAPLAHAQLPEPSAMPPLPVEIMRASRGRAANFARIHAERINGGLGIYRTAACMHQRDGAECLIATTDAGYRFLFLGGPPGWEQLGLPPSVETELLISPDGREVLETIYNGTPRGSR